MYDEILTELSGVSFSDIIKITLNKPKGDIQKATVRPVLLKSAEKWQIEKIINNQAFHQNIDRPDLNGHLLALLNEYEFKSVSLALRGRTVSYSITKKKKLFRSENKTDRGGETALSHDRQKKYILEEGMPIQPLVDLGVFDRNFRVVKSKYDKFRQINKFIEIIADNTDGVFNIIDFGCGKSYLTFILYHYFTEIRKMNVKITGYDLKAGVVANCNKVAEKYGYKNLRFITGDISKIEGGGAVDMMITLHACDTATDYALNFAVKNKVRHIFSVPCCQHEVNAQISSKNEFSILLRHGLYKERFSALITDAVRCEVLSNHGYDVDVIEFVDFDNTPKNAMIRAKLTDKPPGGINPQLKKLTDEFNISPTILRLLDATPW